MDRTKQLTYDYLKDLVVEIRCSRQDNLPTYGAGIVKTFRNLWPNRHSNTLIGAWGIPYVPVRRKK